MSRCRAESFYLSPRDKRSFSKWKLTTTLNGREVEITHRRDLERLSRDPSWDHLVHCESREGLASETHWLDQRLIEGRLPLDQRDWTLHRLESLDPEADGAGLLAHLGHRDVRSLAEALYGPAAREGATGPVVRALGTLLTQAPASRASAVMAFTAACASWLDPERVGALIEHAGASTHTYQSVQVSVLAPALGRILEPYSPTYRARLLRDLWTLSTDGEWWNAVHPASLGDPYADVDPYGNYRDYDDYYYEPGDDPTQLAPQPQGHSLPAIYRALGARSAQREWAAVQRASALEIRRAALERRGGAIRPGHTRYSPYDSIETLSPDALESRLERAFAQKSAYPHNQWDCASRQLQLSLPDLDDEQLRIALPYHARTLREAREVREPRETPASTFALRPTPPGKLTFAQPLSDRELRVAAEVLEGDDLAMLLRRGVDASDELLQGLAAHPHRGVRAAAAGHLATTSIACIRAFREGAGVLAPPEPHEWCSVTEALSYALQSSRVSPALRQSILDAPPAWREAVLGRDECPLWLIEALSTDPEPSVRARAGQALETQQLEHSWRAGSVLEETIERVVPTLVADPVREVREAGYVHLTKRPSLATSLFPELLERAEARGEKELNLLVRSLPREALDGPRLRGGIEKVVPGGVEAALEHYRQSQKNPWAHRDERGRTLERLAAAEGAGQDLYDGFLAAQRGEACLQGHVLSHAAALRGCSPTTAARYREHQDPHMREILATRADLRSSARPPSPIVDLVNRAEAARRSAEVQEAQGGSLKQKRSAKPRGWAELLPFTSETPYDYAPELSARDAQPLPDAPEYTLRLLRTEREVHANATYMENCTFGYRQHMEEGSGAIAVATHLDGRRYNLHLRRERGGWELGEVNSKGNTFNVPDDLKAGSQALVEHLNASRSAWPGDPLGVVDAVSAPGEEIAALAADDLEDALRAGRGKARRRGRRGGRSSGRSGVARVSGVHLPGPRGLAEAELQAVEIIAQ